MLRSTLLPFTRLAEIFALRRTAASLLDTYVGNRPSVNLTARLEKIAGKLSRTVMASSAFAGVSAGGWTDLGEFPIAGFSQPHRVFGLSNEAAI
ncbi:MULTISPECIES: hypothetical protein [unclassified Bradyrhizobium]|uniref:hypothetical protein n=1 Tax=unclassified Bradyrhizobium TaxID=2631580 RepID=UPI0004187D91